MTNLQSKTRKELVLDLLRSGAWVDTATLCSPRVGGSEGTRRLRELRSMGHVIEQRRKAGSSQNEYRLVEEFVMRIPERSVSTFHINYGHGLGATDGSASRRAALSTPWVAWHGSSSKGWTAKYRGYSLSVKEWSSAVYWAATRPDGTQASGKADTLNEAKRAAMEVAL